MLQEIVLNKEVIVTFEEEGNITVVISHKQDVQVEFNIEGGEVLDIDINLGGGKVERFLENVELPLESFQDVEAYIAEAEGYLDKPSPL